MSEDNILDHLRFANHRARIKLHAIVGDVGSMEDNTSPTGLFAGVDVWLDDLWSLTFREIQKGARIKFDEMAKLREFLVLFHFDLAGSIESVPVTFRRDGSVLLSLRAESHMVCASEVALEIVRSPLRKAGVSALSASYAVDEDDIGGRWLVEAVLEDRDRIAGSAREWVRIVRTDLNRSPAVPDSQGQVPTVQQDWSGREAHLLQKALRLSNESFALRLGVATRTVAAWRSRPEVKPNPDNQRRLDRVLKQAPDDVRARFSAHTR
jgi:DNA-binding transcriptional regulator YiaG